VAIKRVTLTPCKKTDDDERSFAVLEIPEGDFVHEIDGGRRVILTDFCLGELQKDVDAALEEMRRLCAADEANLLMGALEEISRGPVPPNLIAEAVHSRTSDYDRARLLFTEIASGRHDRDSDAWTKRISELVTLWQTIDLATQAGRR